MQPREIHPEIDDIVGYAFTRLRWDRWERSDPPACRRDDGMFFGFVTSAFGNWGAHYGIVARRYADALVMVAPAGMTFWRNVGVEVLFRQADLEGKRVPVWDLEKIARDAVETVEIPCSCPETPVQPGPDDELSGPIGLCMMCRCDWCQILPEGVFGPVGPIDVPGGTCRHHVLAGGGSVRWEDYLQRLVTPESVADRCRDRNGVDFLRLHHLLQWERVASEWLEREVAEHLPERREEYVAARARALDDVEAAYEIQLATTRRLHRL